MLTKGTVFTPILSVSTKINAYRSKYGCDPNYIVMNKETLNAIKTSSELVAGSMPATPAYFAFCGTPVAICDNLEFGEFMIV